MGDILVETCKRGTKTWTLFEEGSMSVLFVSEDGKVQPVYSSLLFLLISLSNANSQLTKLFCPCVLFICILTLHETGNC